MYTTAIKYKGLWLAPASKGYTLHQEKKFEELEKHLKEVSKKEKSK